MPLLPAPAGRPHLLQCKKIWATDHTSVGCGPECLNRMLNIECVEVRRCCCIAVRATQLLDLF